jgi:hypothetical protein
MLSKLSKLSKLSMTREFDMSKKIESVMVLRVEDGMVVESHIFAGHNVHEISPLAEKKFKALCQVHISASAWRNIESFLEDGCVIYSNGRDSIQIHHSESTMVILESIVKNNVKKVKNVKKSWIKKGEIFIITPKGVLIKEGLHKICRSRVRGDIVDIAWADKYDEVSWRLNLAAAKYFAKKMGCDNPKVI